MKRALPLFALTLAACAHAQPAPPARPAAAGVSAPAARLPTDVRRATIIVRDMAASLRLYRDIIGMQVNYDTMVTTGGVALPAGTPCTMRSCAVNGWLPDCSPA